METIKIAVNLETNAAQELESSKFANDQSAGEIRALGDWEMVLVAGGEGTPCWP